MGRITVAASAAAICLLRSSRPTLRPLCSINPRLSTPRAPLERLAGAQSTGPSTGELFFTAATEAGGCDRCARSRRPARTAVGTAYAVPRRGQVAHDGVAKWCWRKAIECSPSNRATGWKRATASRPSLPTRWRLYEPLGTRELLALGTPGIARRRRARRPRPADRVPRSCAGKGQRALRPEALAISHRR